MTEYQLTNLEIKARPTPWYNGIAILIRARDVHSQGDWLAVHSLGWEQYDPEVEQGSTLRLQYEHAQTLMDDLWACGLRPTEGKGSAGALAATEAHLKDMQRIAFDLLGAGVHENQNS